MVGVVVAQWMDVIVCKTRRMSNFHQGMGNWVLNFGLLFETGLAAFFLYTPSLGTVLQTTYVRWECWVWPMPFMGFMLVFEEARKAYIRMYPKSFFGQELLF